MFQADSTHMNSAQYLVPAKQMRFSRRTREVDEVAMVNLHRSMKTINMLDLLSSGDDKQISNQSAWP